jgi:triacylglycerol lipase
MNIILVHGILGFAKRLRMDYFRGLPGHFREQGLRVLVPELNPTEGVEFRGNQLRDQIQAAAAAGTIDLTRKTHIIAHSLGGLDSRYILSPANPNQLQVPVRSLTTLSTPHRGSPVADLVDNPLALSPFRLPHLPFAAGPNLLEPVLNALGISLNGLRDLTTSACQSFSEKYVDNPNVSYFSSAGSGRASFPETSVPFLPFHRYISAVTGDPNDGMVPVPSAQWRNFDSSTWAGDHGEMIGYNLDNPISLPAFGHLAKYDQIVARAAAL